MLPFSTFMKLTTSRFGGRRSSLINFRQHAGTDAGASTADVDENAEVVVESVVVSEDPQRPRMLDHHAVEGSTTSVIGERANQTSAVLVVTARVFEHRYGLPFRGEDDVLRVIPTPWGLLVVMANAYECGFSTCWPEGSRTVLDAIQRDVDPKRGPVDAVRAAFNAAVTSVGRMNTAVEDEFDDRGATVTAIGLTTDTAHVAWIGGQHAELHRDGRVVERLAVHTLAEKARADGIDVAALGEDGRVGRVLTRYISGERDEPSTTCWPLNHLDRVVLTSSGFRSEHSWPREAAGRITNALLERLQLPYVACVEIEVRRHS